MRRASSSAKAWPGGSPSVASITRVAYQYKHWEKKMRKVYGSCFFLHIQKKEIIINKPSLVHLYSSTDTDTFCPSFTELEIWKEH